MFNSGYGPSFMVHPAYWFNVLVDLGSQNFNRFNEHHIFLTRIFDNINIGRAVDWVRGFVGYV